jgi:cyclomaltodextrinase
MAAWSGTAIFWQVYPLGFVDAEQHALPPGSPVQHRLLQVQAWLDYLLELGCNGLALNPVFASDSHGYDIVDHFAVDARLGDDDDIDALIAACANMGIRVLFDGVFNHVGRGFHGFVDVLERRQESPYAEWFHLDWTDTDAHDGFGYRTFEGHGALVTLNHDSPAVADYVVAVMEHWLARGIDGWRLDAAYAVPLPFWRAVTDRVRRQFPDAWFVGEVIHGDFPDWVREGGLDSVTQYELWKAVWSSLNDGNFFELGWTLQRHQEFCESFTPLTFVGNHDVTRIASKLTDIRTLEHAVVLLLTLPGVPCIYYGDEQGFRGVKEDREGGDEAVRPAFPAGPDQLADDGWPLYRLHERLIGLRRREPWLTVASVEQLTLANEQLSYRCTGPDGESLVVLLNISDTAVSFPLSGDNAILLDSADGSTGIDAGEIRIGAFGWAVLRQGQ